jgi:CheY-like chemotaxis protein
VADDNRDAAITLSMMLRILGYEIRTAFDGPEALEAAAEFRPDVALLDLGMPKMTGYDVARRLHEQPWGKDVALIAVTGWGQPEDKQRTREAGFGHHLVKPVDPTVLAELLASLSGQRECRLAEQCS